MSRLTEGQSLQARVVDQLSDGRWALRFLGHTLVAESRLNLAKGQVVEARVQDLGPPLVLSIAGRPGSAGEAVMNALNRLGLPTDEIHRAAIAALIRSGRPITRGAVLELTATAEQLRDQIGGDLELEELIGRVLLLQSRGVPVTPDAVAAFLSSVPPGVLGGLVAQLGDLLKSEARRLKLDSTLRDAIENLRESIPDAKDLSPGVLRSWLSRFGLDLEHRLALLGQTENADGLRATLRSALALAQEGTNGRRPRKLGPFARHIEFERTPRPRWGRPDASDSSRIRRGVRNGRHPDFSAGPGRRCAS